MTGPEAPFAGPATLLTSPGPMFPGASEPTPMASPYPAPAPLFGRRWPGPSGPPPRRVLLAAGVAGLGAALALPTARAGVGWLVGALVGVGTMVAIGWRPLRPPGDAVGWRVRLAGVAWLPAAVGLTAVAAVRDADWLVAVSLLAAAGAASLAVADRSFRSVSRGATAVGLAALRGLPWATRGVLSVRRSAAGLRVGASLMVGLALLAVFGPLLAAADPAFARVLDAMVPTLDAGSAVGWVVRFVGGAVGLVGVAFLLAAPPTAGPVPTAESRLRRIEWALPMGLLVALFGLFVGVTITTMFGRDDYVRATTGLTYAEYARSGFWQLLTVTVLTLIVIVVSTRWAPIRTPGERLVARAMLGALAVLTLVVVASAVNRMWLYQQAYGFTELRLVVLTCELWLGTGFVVALVKVVWLRPGGPTRGMVVAGVLALLALAVLDPDRFIAEHDLARYAQTGQVDLDYLSGLSADAVPVLDRLPEPARSCTLARLAQRLGDAEVDGWRGANIGRSEARRILAAAPAHCDLRASTVS